MSQDNNEHKTPGKYDRWIAAAVTMVVTLLLLLLLFLGGLKYDPSLVARSSIPEIIPETETFLEPEILRDLGEEDAVTQNEPAPAEKGVPDEGPQENLRSALQAENPKPKEKPDVAPEARAEKPQPVKAKEPEASAEERQRVTSAMSKFGPKNGTPEGSVGTNGAGGQGTGVSGVASGRTFKGCPKPSVSLRNHVRVVVDVVIDAAGKVVQANARAGASAEIRRACEQAARGARWSAKEGAPETKGTITFNIYPAG